MANFFEAWAGMTKQQAVTAADADGISELPIGGSGLGVLGIWGGDGTANWLKIQVYRGSTVVNEGPRPAVKLELLVESAPDWTRVYRASGLKPGDEIYGMTSTGRRYTAALKVTLVSGTASDLMQEWAKRLKADPAYKPTEPGLCEDAVPYLSLTKKGNAAVKLRDEFVGGPLSAVHGLSVHTTGGGGHRDAFETAVYGCVGTWHKNRDDPDKGWLASTHFCISSDGVLVQIVPTNRKVFAQGDPGDNCWISVEVDNDGSSEMTGDELKAARKLFAWVRRTYGAPPSLAMGTLWFKKGQPDYKKKLDDVTTKICGDAGVPTTTMPFAAAFKRGLSCHLWLDPRNSKPCPGLGILGQLPDIAAP